MFKAEGFKNQLDEAVSTAVGNSGLTRYQTAIIDDLQTLASENESILMERELRKLASERRGIRDALTSARELTKEAAKYAAAEERAVLSVFQPPSR